MCQRPETPVETLPGQLPKRQRLNACSVLCELGKRHPSPQRMEEVNCCSALLKGPSFSTPTAHFSGRLAAKAQRCISMSSMETTHSANSLSPRQTSCAKCS